MRRSSNLGFMALEDNEPKDPEVGDNAESLETDLLDVNDDAEEAAVDDEQVEEAGEVAEALESLATALESASQSGGLDANGAHIARLHTDYLYGRVGMKRSSVPALESFGGTSSRMRSTQIAMEDIVEAAKEIWKKIVDQIKKAIAWVKERFTKIFGAANKLEARAKALATKAAATTGTAKEKQLESERLVKSLNISGAVPANVGNNADEIKKMATTIFGAATTWNGTAGEMILEMLDKPEGVATFKFKAPEFPGITLAAGGPDFGDAGNGMEFKRSSELPGGMALVARVPTAAETSGADGIEVLSRTNVSVGAFAPKAKAPTKTQVATLQPSEAEKIANAVAGIAEEIQSYKRALDKLTQVKEKIVAAAEKAGKTSDQSADEDGKNDRTNYKLLQKLGMATPKLIDQPAGSFSAYALNTGKALLDYVELSLKQYGAK